MNEQIHRRKINTFSVKFNVFIKELIPRKNEHDRVLTEIFVETYSRNLELVQKRRRPPLDGLLEADTEETGLDFGDFAGVAVVVQVP